MQLYIVEKPQNYSLGDCFNTFPFVRLRDSDSRLADELLRARKAVMTTRKEGLTKVLNRVNLPRESDPGIDALRSQRTKYDRAVADAYGWTDLDLGHDFHETKQGIRFTISESARREILDRLLALNHQRYAEEVAQGLHDKGSKTKATRKKARADQEELF
jgi:hypothetical protein